MVKLIALDMDGTLMSTDHITVSEENRKALKYAHDKGVKLAVCTGRTISIIGDVCEQVPEIDYVIYSNGAGVFDRKANKIIYRNNIDNETAAEVIDYLNSQPCLTEMYVDGVSYIQEDKRDFFQWDLFPKIFIEAISAGMVSCNSLKELLNDRSAEKFTFYITNRDKYAEVYDTLSRNDKISLTSSFRLSMEFTAKGVDKGTALEGMCSALGITTDECMSFGDAGNDIPMLKAARYSFAMENGTDACKTAAKYVTKSNAEDGVAHGIYRFI